MMAKNSDLGEVNYSVTQNHKSTPYKEMHKDDPFEDEWEGKGQKLYWALPAECLVEPPVGEKETPCG